MYFLFLGNPYRTNTQQRGTQKKREIPAEAEMQPFCVDKKQHSSDKNKHQHLPVDPRHA